VRARLWSADRAKFYRKSLIQWNRSLSAVCGAVFRRSRLRRRRRHYLHDRPLRRKPPEALNSLRRNFYRIDSRELVIFSARMRPTSQRSRAAPATACSRQSAVGGCEILQGLLSRYLRANRDARRKLAKVMGFAEQCAGWIKIPILRADVDARPERRGHSQAGVTARRPTATSRRDSVVTLRADALRKRQRHGAT
jgi:hypothetical protein